VPGLHLCAWVRVNLGPQGALAGIADRPRSDIRQLAAEVRNGSFTSISRCP
jgi:hypothetical protein